VQDIERADIGVAEAPRPRAKSASISPQRRGRRSDLITYTQSRRAFRWRVLAQAPGEPAGSGSGQQHPSGRRRFFKSRDRTPSGCSRIPEERGLTCAGRGRGELNAYSVEWRAHAAQSRGFAYRPIPKPATCENRGSICRQPNTDERPRSGMYAQVSLELGRRNDVLAVPGPA